ncbi:MAG: hypothetical protein IPL77_14510 [Flavobacteriales bacterium]|nr:hypothetical protein [Flavobacteriales bacterium]
MMWLKFLGGPSLTRAAWGIAQPDRGDAWGVVRSEPALNNGPTTVLARKELSTGLYMVEVLRDGKTLGTSKVMFE